MFACVCDYVCMYTKMEGILAVGKKERDREIEKMRGRSQGKRV